MKLRPIAMLGVALPCLAAASGSPREGMAPAGTPAAGMAVLDELTPSRAYIRGPVSAMALGPDGVLFVGSTILSVYDGWRWQRIETPGLQRVLEFDAAPVAAERRVWVSGAGGQGCLTRQPTGAWRFAAAAPSPAARGDRLKRDTHRPGAGLPPTLQRLQPTCEASMGSGVTAIGTLLGGVVLLDANGAVVAHIDSRNGLIDDNIHALLPDGSGRLWIGMSRGIALLSGAARVWLVDHRSGIGNGVARKVVEHRGVPEVLTSRALYSLAPAVHEIPETWPEDGRPWTELWDAASLGNELWVAGSAGLWRASESEAKNVLPRTADMLLEAPFGATADRMLLLKRGKVELWRRHAGTWSVRELPCMLDAPPASETQDAGGRIWIASVSGEVTALERADPGEGFRVAARYRLDSGSPIPAPRPLLSSIGATVVAFTDDGILAKGPEAAAFVPITGLESFIGIAAASDVAGPAYWIVQCRAFGAAGSYALLRIDLGPDGTFRWTPLALPGIDQIGQVTSLNLLGAGAGARLWAGGTNGVLAAKLDGLEPAEAAPAVRLESFSIDRAGQPLAAGPNPPRAGPDADRIAFAFPAGARLGASSLLFQTKLEPAEPDWSLPQATPEREFTRLTPGAYVFAARSLDRFGRPGPALRFAFVVLAPWYRRGPVLAGFAALGVLGVVGVMRLRLRRLHRQSERLNRLVDERTRELSLSNTAKSEFIENICHEIRNPLQGVVGLIGLLGEEQLHGQPKTLAESLKACAQSLQRAFDDVLSFSKVEYGFVAVQIRPFRLRPALESVCGVFYSQAVRQGNRIELRVPEGWDDRFEGDEEKIKTIISNFVANALKYAPGTAVTVAVSEVPATDPLPDPDRPMLVIEVADEGPGITAEEQELIFRKFVRGAEARRANLPGTGIGLAASRALAKAMGGNIGVDSVPGKGATFFLRIALARPQAPVEAAPSPPLKYAGAPVLIVEDQPYNQVVLAGLVQGLGYRPTCAANANEAAAEAAEPGREAFALVLLDLELPGAKGPDAARRLRTFPRVGDAIILAISAHEGPDSAARCAEAGMDGFLVKPVARETIQEAVTAARARRNSDGEMDLGSLELYARRSAGGLPQAIDVYVATLVREATGAAAALRGGPAGSAAAAVHRLHSHVAIVRAGRLLRRLDALESALRAGHAPSTDLELPALEQETARLIAALNARKAPPAG